MRNHFNLIFLKLVIYIFLSFCFSCKQTQKNNDYEFINSKIDTSKNEFNNLRRIFFFKNQSKTDSIKYVLKECNCYYKDDTLFVNIFHKSYWMYSNVEIKLLNDIIVQSTQIYRDDVFDTTFVTQKIILQIDKKMLAKNLLIGKLDVKNIQKSNGGTEIIKGYFKCEIGKH